MAKHTTGKLNHLLQEWSRGTVATLMWLRRLGISSNLANWHVRSGWLVRFGPRAFVQPGDRVDWQGGLYALQSQLNMTIHVGARTALELLGRSHFVPLGRRKTVVLISDRPEQLPAWFRNHPWEVNVKHTCLSLFTALPAKAVTRLDCGGFELVASSAERAVMEEMRCAQTNGAIEHVCQLMDGLTMLRPDVVQNLLELCRSVKVKRLFLWSAERAGHAWFQRLDLSLVNLGKGKRQIYKKGTLDRKYQITVPQEEELPDV